jgi:hypothetical protein
MATRHAQRILTGLTNGARRRIIVGLRNGGAVKRILGYLSVVLVVLGCSFGEELQDPGDPVDMTPSSLAGTWHGGTQRFITFQPDGTFSAVNLPVPPFQDAVGRGFDPKHDRLDGAGTWALPDPPVGPSPRVHSTVHLSFDHLAGRRVYFDGPDLAALRPGDGNVYLVFFYVGDEGNSTTGYLKCTGDCVVPSPAGPVGEPAEPRPS